ncbi:MAG TPA: HAMP domain-containing sensor histidine kinase [Symbiobacteriaceae bacterium]|nr:HAMP domain-containing sensor histidine kinase [Symbiobacteriaceae bacterium]
MKRTFSIRTWLIAGIAAMVVVAYVGVGVVAYINEMVAPAGRTEVERLAPGESTLLMQEVEAAYARWGDPAWQAEIGPRLTAAGLGVRLSSPDDRVIFLQANVRTSGYRVIGHFGSARIYDGGGLVGTASWWDLRETPENTAETRIAVWEQYGIPIAIVVIVGATIWFFVSLASRAVLGPVKAAARAAEHVNSGDLNVDLPFTRVRELNDFAGAFARMRDGLRESLAGQAAMEQERRLFIAAMAHDLRTPLTSVRGYLEGIRDGVARTPDMLERYVRVALEKTTALERLVDGLFNYSRTEYLSQAPQAEPLELGAFVSGVLSGMQPQAKGIALSTDPTPEPVTVNGDPAMLQRVLDNLLDNALRYTPAGGQVTVGWRGEAEHTKIWVQDTGPGVPPEDLERVFDPLYRSDKARSTRTGGAGLGLAIARRLVEAHGGTITAANDGGARFTITLPR